MKTHKNNLVIFFILLGAFKISAQSSSVKTFSSIERDDHGPIICDATGNIYTVIYSGKSGKLIKMDPQGNALWTIEDSCWYPSGIDITGNALYVTGAFKSGWDTGISTIQSKGMNDIFIARYDLSGNKIWIQVGGGLENESGRFIDVDTNGHVFVSGSYYGNISLANTTLQHSGESDIFLTCYDTDGYKLWIKSIAGSLADELYGMVWIEQKQILLLNAYLQLSVNLGNQFITPNNSHVTAAYNEGGIVQDMIEGPNEMKLLAVDTANSSIYLHTGTEYYDTTGTIYNYDYDFEQQFKVKVRKGTKFMLFKNNRTYIFGSTPVISNSIVRQAGYIDCYDEALTLRSKSTLGAKASINSGCLSNEIFWFMGTFMDTADIYHHKVTASKGDQDVFLLRIDEPALGLPSLERKELLSIYPNPAGNMLMLKGIPDWQNISIHSVDGRLVRSVNYVDHIDVSDLAPGIYILQTPDKRAIKFIKA
jgi:hypothetical protein